MIRLGAPPPKSGGEKPRFFNTASLNLHSIPFHSFRGFFHITVLPSFHTTRKIILQQCKRTVKHLQAMIHIRLLQHAETKTILFMSLADANISLEFICRVPTMSGFFFLNCFPLHNEEMFSL